MSGTIATGLRVDVDDGAAPDFPIEQAAARKRFEAGTRRLTDSIADVLGAMKHPHPDALAASVVPEMMGTMAIARVVSNNERSEQILKATRDSIEARIGLVA